MYNQLVKLYIYTVLCLMYFMFIFSLCRTGFIINTGFINSAIMDSNGYTSFSDIINTLLAGLRFDSRLAAPITFILMAIYIILSFIKPIKTNKLKNIIIMVLVSTLSYIIIVTSFVNDTYYSIFNDTFNIILLGAIYDDQTAILQTAINSNYYVIPKIILSIIITFALVFVYYKIYKKIEKIEKTISLRNTILFGLVITYLLILTTSSTFNLKGGSLNYLVTLPENNFLKKATPGALYDLDRVYKAYNGIKGESFEKYSGGKSINEIMEIYFDSEYKNYDNISKQLEKTVLENGKIKVEHIFLIIMESLSEYHLSEEFMQAGIGNELIELANSENGLKIPVFIQNGFGTIETMDMMITGLYGTYFPISEMTGKIPCFQSSTGKIFKDLGYNTNFYYFGSSAWRKIGTYTLSQGFDNSYAMENMHNKEKATWGIYDSEGFDFILENIKKQDNNKPTFNMVLSASNHPPYDINTDKFYNIDKAKIKNLLDTNYPKDKRYKGITPEILTVTEYSIKSVADFVKQMYRENPESLFIITGDHFDRIHPNTNRTTYISTSIPLIIYGYGVNEYKAKYSAGSHKDIVPTIVEMVAPKDYIYNSFGDSLVTSNNLINIDKERIALGSQSITNGRWTYNVGGVFRVFC